MKSNFSEQMRSLNKSYKETDEVYHDYAKQCGLPDTAFWVLYSLWDQEQTYTQREFCLEWFYNPQTINSALKGLEKQGFIELPLMPGNRKNKQISFTEKGKELAERVIVPLMKAEQDSFSHLNKAEREILLSVTQKRIRLLKEEISKIETN